MTHGETASHEKQGFQTFISFSYNLLTVIYMKCNLRRINLVRILSVWTHVTLKAPSAQALMIIGDSQAEQSQAQSLSTGGIKKTLFVLMNPLSHQQFDRRNAKLFTSDLSKKKTKTAGQTVCIYIYIYCCFFLYCYKLDKVSSGSLTLEHFSTHAPSRTGKSKIGCM